MYQQIQKCVHFVRLYFKTVQNKIQQTLLIRRCIDEYGWTNKNKEMAK